MSRQEGLAYFGFLEDRPVITVIGGSQGSAAINGAISESLHLLIEAVNPQMIWQTGSAHHRSLRQFEATYPSVKVFPFLDEIGYAYAAADVVVSRAGALTLAEIANCGKPSLLIPFAGAAADHQTKNARTLEKAGAAVVLAEAELSPERLTEEIEGILKDRERAQKMSAAAKSVAIADAAEKIVDQLLSLAQA